MIEDALRQKFQKLPKPDKARFIDGLDGHSYVQFRFFSDIMLRDNQIITPGDWRYWLFIGGRGTGKTKV